jgi:hypothetical protein
MDVVDTHEVERHCVPTRVAVGVGLEFAKLKPCSVMLVPVPILVGALGVVDVVKTAASNVKLSARVATIKLTVRARDKVEASPMYASVGRHTTFVTEFQLEVWQSPSESVPEKMLVVGVGAFVPKFMPTSVSEPVESGVFSACEKETTGESYENVVSLVPRTAPTDTTCPIKSCEEKSPLDEMHFTTELLTQMDEAHFERPILTVLEKSTAPKLKPSIVTADEPDCPELRKACVITGASNVSRSVFSIIFDQPLPVCKYTSTEAIVPRVAIVESDTNRVVPQSTEVVDTYAVLHMIESDPESAFKYAVGEGSAVPNESPTIVMVKPPLSGALYLKMPVMDPPATCHFDGQRSSTRSMHWAARRIACVVYITEW